MNVTDRQTDGWTDGQLSVALRGSKWLYNSASTTRKPS